MAIKFQCACGRKLKAGDELAGRRGKCPGCGTQFIIPFVAEPLRSQLPADETFAEYIPPPTDSAASSADAATSSTLWSALPVIAPITASVGDVLPVEFDSRVSVVSVVPHE